MNFCAESRSGKHWSIHPTTLNWPPPTSICWGLQCSTFLQGTATQMQMFNDMCNAQGKTKNTDVLGDHAENGNVCNILTVWLKDFSKTLYCLTLIDTILILCWVWMSIKYINVLNKLFTPFCYSKGHLSLWYHCLLLCVLIYMTSKLVTYEPRHCILPHLVDHANTGHISQ
jgi:hypothetical protein